MICEIDKKKFCLSITDLLEQIINTLNEEEIGEVIEYFGWHEQLRKCVLHQLQDFYFSDSDQVNKERETILNEMNRNVIAYRADKISERLDKYQAIEQYNRYLLDIIQEHNRKYPNNEIEGWYSNNQWSFRDLPTRWKNEKEIRKILMEEA